MSAGEGINPEDPEWIDFGGSSIKSSGTASWLSNPSRGGLPSSLLSTSIGPSISSQSLGSGAYRGGLAPASSLFADNGLGFAGSSHPITIAQNEGGAGRGLGGLLPEPAAEDSEVLSGTTDPVTREPKLGPNEALEKPEQEDDNAAGRRVAPGKASDTLAHIQRYGEAPFGHVGGKVFDNREGLLPSGGQYLEYDVDPLLPGVRRNAERLIIDSVSGRAWYTDDHYSSFTQIYGPK